MKQRFRVLLAAIAALLLALPAFSGGGGGAAGAGGASHNFGGGYGGPGAGGGRGGNRGGGGGGDSTGVWILPRSCLLGTLPPSTVTTPRGTVTYNGFQNPITLKVSPDVIRPAASLLDPITNQLVGLPVAGDTVTIPAATINHYAGLGITTVYGVILGANGRGYYLRLRLNLAQNTVQIEIF